MMLVLPHHAPGDKFTFWLSYRPQFILLKLPAQLKELKTFVISTYFTKVEETYW